MVLTITMCNFFGLATLLLSIAVAVMGTKKLDTASVGLKDNKAPKADDGPLTISRKELDIIFGEGMYNNFNEKKGKAVKHPSHKVQLGALGHVAPGHRDKPRRKDQELPRMVPHHPKTQPKKFGLHTRNSINDNRFDRKHMKRSKGH
ncbi:uncharacterized protein LOC124354077 [Homalodisca vitripennis]|uniref:uncharacterized protein LOC124354077 n=1 Tax=Homalodisca vitripennis TaxID=197043 RepID=UPI001EEABDFD|nr:uncharacterized protein LOC124354077 [Homalodisca vitripennis]